MVNPRDRARPYAAVYDARVSKSAVAKGLNEIGQRVKTGLDSTRKWVERGGRKRKGEEVRGPNVARGEWEAVGKDKGERRE